MAVIGGRRFRVERFDKAHQPRYCAAPMPELVAIWVAGLVLMLVAFGVVAAVLRFTAAGRAQRMPLGDVAKILAVVVGLSCAVISLLVLLS